MITAASRTRWFFLGVLVLCSACATATHDYASYRTHMPRSILVLPPLNESTDVNAPYSYLSTVTQPLGECGYYVFPVALVDAFMKDNGLPTPGEMHTVSLRKISDVFGADSVMYVNIEDWGQKYQILSSTTVVKAQVRLADVVSGTTLWQGKVQAAEGSGGSGSLVADLILAAVEQIADTVIDRTHGVARQANVAAFFHKDTGLLFGPRSPNYASDSRGR